MCDIVYLQFVGTTIPYLLQKLMDKHVIPHECQLVMNNEIKTVREQVEKIDPSATENSKILSAESETVFSDSGYNQA
ncbi:MAG: hypothetical protein JAY75_09635 [Candidatus Thiodiazotropha taylori]|nr:hypothetical protein [Candidatus Thiodiazotropha taylori]MCG8112005.1 hypothetical protein [Candidatus Thiodiazotropha taylori]MCW4284361.1 hypothetical protein [Candidatus Thiodiazotropha taylori]MCW4308476.1 hypothetical protein [Candidatus Thiodiazotropha endolucinida]